MKIGIVCYPTYGGSGVVATELGIALASKGHEVHFIAYRQPFRLDDYTENIYFHEVNVTEYPLFEYPPYELSLSAKLIEVVTYEKLDILHVHYAIPHAAAAYMAQKILFDSNIIIPFITTLHGTDITLVGKDATLKPVVSYIINHSDAVSAVSENLKKETKSFFNIDKNIVVIPNFIDTKKYNPEFNNRTKLSFAPKGEKIIMHLSNFRKVKRVEDIINIFKLVREQFTAKLILIGDGPERSRIEEMCRAYHLCEDVKFLGKIKSTEKILPLADIFLLPSETESFGLAALEALACGVPVISSDTGGIPEVNIHNYSGYLSKVGDVKTMTNYAINLLKDSDLLAKVRKQAREHALKYDRNKVLVVYEKLYQKTIEEVRKLTAHH